jgi:hypothetical protein
MMLDSAGAISGAHHIPGGSCFSDIYLHSSVLQVAFAEVTSGPGEQKGGVGVAY